MLTKSYLQPHSRSKSYLQLMKPSINQDSSSQATKKDSWVLMRKKWIVEVKLKMELL